MRSRGLFVLMRTLSLAFMVFSVTVLTGCPDKKAKYPICAKDKDCKEGEHCVDKQCQQCAKDSHCKEGQECKAGACVKKSGWCDSNDDCPSGKVCKRNQCVACESDNECGADSKCSNGACLARGACNVDEDCADDEDCIDGVCQRPGRGPPPDVDCRLATVYFDFDRTQVSDDAKASLSQTAECIQSAAERNVFIEGHTDPRGTEEYNIALSESRGQIIADYLARLGIDPARFRVIPKGETEASGTDEGTWAQDRRVEFEWQ